MRSRLLLLLTLFQCRSRAAPEETAGQSAKPLVVVGSLNVDITVEVDRLPEKDETLTARSPASELAVGGKGANQAVAGARVAAGTGRSVRFICQLGSDAYASWLESALRDNDVDISGCGRSDLPSGQGIVLLGTDGSATSVVVGGSNTDWRRTGAGYADVLRGAGAVMLQREIPEEVNAAVAAAAKAAGVTVIQDVGGEDRPISDEMLRLIDFLCPNENELQRLTGMPTSTEEEVLAAARHLQARGARSVLVTLGVRGALLLQEGGSEVLRQESQPVPGGKVLDATAAGDAFRAAFAVALVEGQPLRSALRLAAAAGAIAVSKRGAVPSLPSRAACEALLRGRAVEEVDGTCASSSCGKASQAPFPKKFASRLNSMKERLDLWEGAVDALGLVARQGTVQGLDLVYFNFPQHLAGLEPQAVRGALRAANLQAGGVAMRFPESMRLGAFTGPDEAVRQQAIEMTVDGCRWAQDIGSDELVVWPQTDGYDYQMQLDYPAAWARAVDSFTKVADAEPCSSIKVSLEFKPTDEISRFAIVPSTGAALLLVREVNRSNLGLTLDVGHLFMAGENPAQSVAMVGSAGKLFGVHLNDGHSRLGAEDGLMFGSVHLTAALEVVLWLQKTDYQGHVYFDTFPRTEDPVREAEYNIRRFKALWRRAERLRAAGLDGFLERHDAQGALELLESLEIS